MTGCNVTVEMKQAPAILFQSTAGPMTGCNDGERPAVQRWAVSIHSRPHDRLQRAGGPCGLAGAFQSTAGPMTGCNRRAASGAEPRTRFQSTAGPMTGCNRSDRVRIIRQFQFQSTAGPMTGCN